MPWYTVDAGSGTSSAGSFYLSGTIGQFDIGLSGDEPAGFLFVGGFWVILAPTAASPAVFGDGFESGDTSRWSQEAP